MIYSAEYSEIIQHILHIKIFILSLIYTANVVLFYKQTNFLLKNL